MTAVPLILPGTPLFNALADILASAIVAEVQRRRVERARLAEASERDLAALIETSK